MAAADGEARVLLTAQSIVKALGTTDTMTDDMIQILSTFDHRFSSMNEKKMDIKLEPISLPEPEGNAEFQSPRSNRGVRSSSHARANNSALDAAENVIVQWDAGYSEQARQEWIFESAPDESSSYLDAVDEVLKQLEAMKVHNRDPGTLERARNLLQLAMARLEEEFRHILEKYCQSADPDWLLDTLAAGYFKTPLNDVVDPESGSSEDDDSDEDVPVARPVGELQTTVDLVPPEVAQDLFEVVTRLMAGGYKRDCSQVYVTSRKAVLEESLYELGVERLTIDEVQKMQWEVQEDRIKKWNQAMKVGVKVLFASEKQLCDKVFSPSISDTIFNDIAKGAMMQLLSFGEAIAISRRSPEKLFKVLDMYETLQDLLPDLDDIFSGTSGASVRSEAKGILMRLGEAARGTFAEFENAIQRDASKSQVHGGAVHPLTRYVMNYILLLYDYIDTLKQLFGEKKELPNLLGHDASLSDYAENDRGDKGGLSPLAVQINWLTHVLQNNLEGKSKIYKDPALTHLFLMNNVHYIVQKVKSSELRSLIGDDWVKKHTSTVRQCATSYQRAAWSKVLSFLKDEGIQSTGVSSGVSRVTLKDRFKNFNTAFDEAHRIQSQWIILDPQLRDEMRISITEKLLPAYRAFVGRYGHYIEKERRPEKYIKYTVEDLEIAVGDFFEGTTGSMRKSLSSHSSQ